MPHFLPVLLVIAFAAVVVTLSALGRRLPVPPPILQVGAGLALSLLPGVTVPELEPDLVFFLFLPPILWAAAFFTSWREFDRNRRPIALLAVGLVIVTTAAVAITAHALLPGLPWAVAVVIGAIVSPPDAVAAEAIVARLPVPRRVVVILSGESLVNDASALVLYRTAVAAAVTGVFSWSEAVVRFFIDAGLGIGIGLLTGWLIITIARRTRDSLVETLLTLVGPYVAWVAAESLHVSAVLACVAGGYMVRRRFSTAVGPLSRIESKAVWDLFLFIVNALVFLLLGLQLGVALHESSAAMLETAFTAGAVLTVVAIGVRLTWVPLATWLPRALSAEVRARDPVPDPRGVFLVGWTAMRGIVSLATALALPRTLADGTPFPYRDEILLITMTVIVLTLVVQGLSLEPIIRRFAFTAETGHLAEAAMARREALRAARETLEDLQRERGHAADDVAALHVEIDERLRHHMLRGGRSRERSALRLAVLDAERRMLVRLRDEGAISDEVLLDLETELDLEATRIDRALHGGSHH